MKYKKVLIGNDPWSETFKSVQRSLSRYKTVKEWQKSPNINIKDTCYYKDFLALLKREGTIWNGIINNEEELLKQALNFRQMYDKRFNWRDINGNIVPSKDGTWFYGDYPVEIRDNGSMALYDGFHRMAILLACDQPIYVTIVKRNPEWDKLYKGIESLYPSHSLYQPIDHPDFSDWECQRGDKKEMVLRNIINKFNIKTVVDCGVCHGYTLYRLRDLIKHGVGLEYNQVRYEITKKIYDKINFTAHKSNIMNFRFLKYDSVFCLAVFHHLMRQHSRVDFERLVKKISSSCKYLVVSLPESDESQFNWMYEDIKFNAYQYIKNLSGFKNGLTYNTGKRRMKVFY